MDEKISSLNEYIQKQDEKIKDNEEKFQKAVETIQTLVTGMQEFRVDLNKKTAKDSLMPTPKSSQQPVLVQQSFKPIDESKFITKDRLDQMTSGVETKFKRSLENLNNILHEKIASKLEDMNTDLSKK